jgi:hypothetical protein
MACALQPDPSDRCDFIASTGSNVTVKVASTTPGVIAGLATAKLNKKPLPVTNGDTTNFTVAAGVNTLGLVITVSDPQCTVQVLEDCGGGNTQILDQFKNDPADPVVGYSICAS